MCRGIAVFLIGMWMTAGLGSAGDLGEVTVESPAHGADIAGATTLRIAAPGWASATVKCWKPDGRSGSDSTIGRVSLDAEGRGTVVLPGDKYPRGPLMVRVIAEGEKESRTCLLQVYNTGGVQWNAGAKEAPKAARGMKLLFEDEFDKPLSISRDGKGATYASHKPGGGDFSGIPFGDHEDAAKTPFAQREGFLRIRADEKKGGGGATGLISSLRMDGTGVTARAPCYFECRFVAGSAPGTWPAFWVMTRDVYKGLKEPADELDVVEAYGGEGKGQPNQRGYWINSHYWNQGPDGGKDESQDRFSGMIEMAKLAGGSGSSWYETFHTYGVLVGVEETVYYCDEIEVARHKTARLSKAQTLFFMVNLAIGGTSGWAKDLSKCGGVADMYVDYVRVYEGVAKD